MILSRVLPLSGASAPEKDNSIPATAAWRLACRAPGPAAAAHLTTGLLLVCPGFNGDGSAACRENGPWAQFADRYNLWILAPTFYGDPENIRDRNACYYYPESGGFDWLLNEIDKLADRHGVAERKLLLFGFSAGAQVVHRLVIWRPERVKAAVACSAGWWDVPGPTVQSVSMLIMCGERDARYEAGIAFYRETLRLDWPVAWRSFAGLGHAMDKRVLALAQAFLAAHVQPCGSNPWVGDIQEWRAYPAASEDAQSIPPAYRVILPSENMARVWETIAEDNP